MTNEVTQEVKALVAKFDPSKDHATIIGEEGIAFQQAGNLFNKAGKLVQRVIAKVKSAEQILIESLHAEKAKLTSELAAAHTLIAKMQLKIPADVVVNPAPGPSATVIVDGAGPVVTVTQVEQGPLELSAAGSQTAPVSKTLTLAGIVKSQ